MNLRNTLLAAALSLGLCATPAQGQDRIEAVASDTKSKSRIRPHLTYDIPGGNGYTFIEFYGDGDNYYARNMLRFNLTDHIKARGDILNGSQFSDQAAVGAEYQMSTTDINARIGAHPLWINKNGRLDKATVNGAITADLTDNLSVEAFAEADILNQDFLYGEAKLRRDITDGLSVSAGVDMRYDTDLSPQIDPHVALQYTP